MKAVPMEEIPDEPFAEIQAIDEFKKIERERQLPVLRIRVKSPDPVLLDVEMEDRSHMQFVYADGKIMEMPKVYFSCEDPSLAEIRAVQQLLAMTEDCKLKLDFVVVVGDHVAAVFPSGSYLEYKICQGNLVDVDEKNDFLRQEIPIIWRHEHGENISAERS